MTWPDLQGSGYGNEGLLLCQAKFAPLSTPLNLQVNLQWSNEIPRLEKLDAKEAHAVLH
jgi:hypothetical protein